jgi:hypothetical protein
MSSTDSSDEEDVVVYCYFRKGNKKKDVGLIRILKQISTAEYS